MNHNTAVKHTMHIYYEHKIFNFIYSTKINSLLPMNKELDNKLNVSSSQTKKCSAQT